MLSGASTGGLHLQPRACPCLFRLAALLTMGEPCRPQGQAGRERSVDGRHGGVRAAPGPTACQQRHPALHACPAGAGGPGGAASGHRRPAACSGASLHAHRAGHGAPERWTPRRGPPPAACTAAPPPPPLTAAAALARARAHPSRHRCLQVHRGAVEAEAERCAPLPAPREVLGVPAAARHGAPGAAQPPRQGAPHGLQVQAGLRGVPHPRAPRRPQEAHLQGAALPEGAAGMVG